MPNSKPKTTTHGRCFCRAIEYEFEGKPKWVMHCHCESCRRSSSSVLATFVCVKLEQFRYMKGEPNFWESSPGVKRYFCSTCGAPMAYVGARWPGEVHLLHGTLDDPSQWPPTGHVNVDEQLPWFEVHDELPRFKTIGGKDTPPVRHGPVHGKG